MNETIELLIADAKIAIPKATVMRNFLDSIERKPHAGIPPIGAEWPGQGGIHAAMMRGRDGKPDYHLIIRASGAAFIDIEWGGYGEAEPNATDEYDGLANTVALIDSSKEHPAAKKCAAFEADGHADFYLPAKRELMAIAAQMPEIFEEGYYWSSTQYSAENAWAHDFVYGYLTNDVKGLDLRAFPVRRLII